MAFFDYFVVPWQFLHSTVESEQILYWRIVFLAFLLAVVSFVSQWYKPAPYGRFDPKDGTWGPQVNQCIAHVLNDGLWGVLFFCFIVVNRGRSQSVVNNVFVVVWLCHFVHRGFVHPFLMIYSSPTVALGIPVTGLTLALFGFLHAEFFGMTTYDGSYVTDVRFLIGASIFVSGFVINRMSDYKLRGLRRKSGVPKYFIPRGFLFEWISCPNYFGEMVQWFGWAMATWSPCGFVYFLFTLSTFVPRSRQNHFWYKAKFRNYPRNRKALIPYIY